MTTHPSAAEQGRTGDEGWSTVTNSNKCKSKKRSNRGRKDGSQSQPSSLSLPPSSPLFVEPIPPTDDNIRFQPFMLLLVGLPGSGKSTLAMALEHAMPYKFVRINQDQLGSRKKCESKLRSVLYNETNPLQRCPIIDRCNFDSQQRSTWYSMAEEYRTQQQQLNQNQQSTMQLLPVDVIVLDVPSSECLRRCQQRLHHETLNKKNAKRVIQMVQQQWQLPSQQSATERNRYRSLTIVKSQEDVEQCLWRLLDQME
ncbi:AAA domain containing protein [Nitzschia inconspicua]|uniref:AAA domain containing protein n=1 Tax=Nitzschia inconspicua TaxID=303405 RepID=A0A9K3LIR4_9STRA|nr:AAA domain containing protein [Nitzschia inconspicua]KAG7362499.1 AAA domain containing protein [Nitzschia inconspicua]